MSFKKNVIANYFGQVWMALMGLAFVPIYIRYLGVEAWGLVGFMAMLQSWLVLLDMGLSTTLSREIARFHAGAHGIQIIRNLLRSLEIIYIGIAVVVVGVVWIGSSWIAIYWLDSKYLHNQSVGHAISIMGLVLATRMVEQVYRGAIQGLQRQVWLNGAQSLLATLRWGGAVGVLALIDNTIETFFWWQGLVSLFTIAILARKTYHWLPSSNRPAIFDLAALVSIRRFAGGIATITLLSAILMQIDKLLLSKLVTLDEFGHYILAGSVAAVLSFIATPINMAASPRLTQLVTKKNEEELIETYHHVSQWQAVLLIPPALMMAAFAEPLLMVWMGKTKLTEQVAPLLTILSLGAMCNGLMFVPYTMQLAHGWTSFAVRTNVIAIIFIVPAVLWAVPSYGAIGAAWAWLALNLGYILIAIHFMHIRILPLEKWRWYRESFFKPFISGTIVVVVLRMSIILPQDRVWTMISIVGIYFFVMGVVLWSATASRNFLKLKYKLLRRYLING